MVLQKGLPPLTGRSTSFSPCNQNKAAESSIARLNVRRSYEAGRGDATEASNEGWMPEASGVSPVRSETFDPIAMIDRLVQDAVAQRVAKLVPANVAPLAPAIAPPVIVAPTELAKSDGPPASTPDRMSVLLQEFLRPADRKRQHKMKGRGEAEAVVQFAIDLLGDPRMSELTEEKWKLLDEALPDIPNRDNIPREFSKTLFERYKYAETHGWSELVGVTTTTIKSRYWGGPCTSSSTGPSRRSTTADLATPSNASILKTWRRCRVTLLMTRNCLRCSSSRCSPDARTACTSGKRVDISCSRTSTGAF